MMILIVDDVEVNVQVLRRMAMRIGDVEVVTFTDPAKALEWCETNEPDLILLDYMMPEINGIEFLERIRMRSHLATVPVVVVTGQEDRPTLYRALEAGANDFLIKPVDSAELIARARNMLRLRSATRYLYRLATTDELTGVANRGHFLESLADETRRVTRYAQPMSLAMFDVDHFKLVNDTFGHPAGDKVLQTIATITRDSFRNVDMVGRIGGEEFAVLMPATDLAGAKIACERVRQAIERAEIVSDDKIIRATVSIGVAELIKGEDAGILLARVDRALYGAKENGRNRVELSRETKIAGT